MSMRAISAKQAERPDGMRRSAGAAPRATAGHAEPQAAVRGPDAQGPDAPGTPRMTVARCLRAEALRLRRSPLIPLHLACSATAGLACGAYFAYAPWDPALGADAYAQFLGACMPLMTGIVCGLDIDAEREVGELANLTAVPSRRRAIAARWVALTAMGSAAPALAMGVFAGILALAGRNVLPAEAYLGSAAGLAAGSAVLYALLLAAALRFGRNVAIGVGAAGLACALFSVGGLAHGLMTGELTAAAGGIFGAAPFAWPARLGSLAVEVAIAAGDAGNAGLAASAGSNAVAAAAWQTGLLCAVVTAIALIALLAWFNRYEDRRR